MSDDNVTRMQRLGYRKPADVAEPGQLVLVDYVSEGRVAVITLNRPHADNAITTELAAQFIEVLETIAARSSVRVAILTGAGDRAFSVGGDLYQRKEMTKEQWLRQRQVFDRVLYTLRQLRRPIFTAVHGMAYGGGCEIAISTDFIIASNDAVFGQPEAMVGLIGRRRLAGLLPRALPPGKAMQMLMTGEADHRTRGVSVRHGQRTPSLRPNSWMRRSISRKGSPATRRRRCKRSSGPFRWDKVSRSSRPSPS
jgi:enoyl-CoA hydratase